MTVPNLKTEFTPMHKQAPLSSYLLFALILFEFIDLELEAIHGVH